MQKEIKNWIFTLIFMGVIFFLTNSCSKMDDNNNSNNNNNDTVKTGTVADIDSNIYKTVKIGDHWWMAENLKTTKYNDGSAIPLVTDGISWGNLTTPGYCWYNNNATTYKNTYGALYNWYAVNSGKLCPTGWHVPTDAEWTTLTKYLGGVFVAGAKLKSIGTIGDGTGLWVSHNYGATNESGFTAVPAGCRYSDNGSYGYLSYFSYWWSSSAESSTENAWFWNVYYGDNSVGRSSSKKYEGYSVRCIKD